jgi:uncharacterized protein (TIGR03437 family)
VIHIPYWMLLGAPNIPTGGLVDGASFGKSVAPGGIVSVFGTSLGNNGYGAPYLPLPHDLNHTVVTVDANDGNGETYTPLFYSSSGQVNFQIPFSLPACSGTTACNTLRVYLEGIVSNSFNFPLAATAPGIFVANGVGIVVHSSTQALVTAANPATAGEIVTIYCAGLGAVNSTIYTGDPSPIPPATTMAATTVSFGGKAASVGFSGLTPNFAGLYQINATIAAGTPTGSQSLTITVGGATSAAVTTFVK